MGTGRRKVFSSINIMKLVTQNYLFGKSDCFQEILGKSTSFEKVHVLNNSLF